MADLIRTLVLAGDRESESLAPWLDYLSRTGEVAAEVVGDASALTRLEGFDVVVAHGATTELEPDQEAGLCDFVEAGGGFVGLHCTNARWAGRRRYLEMVAGSPDGSMPEGEIRSEVSDRGHQITRRMPGELLLRDSCFGQGVASEAGCRVLLATTWASRPVPVAYSRRAGRGRVFYCGLGEAASSYASLPFQELLYRGLRHAAGRVEAPTVGLGLVGFGAIGEEHAGAIARVPGLELRAVCDPRQERVEVAQATTPGVKAAADLEAMLGMSGVDAVVVSTPPVSHGRLARQALEAGRHVVVEKPFCLGAEEAGGLLELARRSGLTLTVYQNRRWDPDFLALKLLVAGGALGRVFHLESFVGGFEHPCHLWHSDREVSGGVIYDWGAHYLDWILELLPGKVVEVAASSQKLVWHDVSNDDHFQLRLRFEDGADAEFTHSDIAAARKPKWYLLGTEGAALGIWREGAIATRDAGGVREERLRVTDVPCELHLMLPGPEGHSHDQTVALPTPPPQAFYRNLAGHILAAEPLAVPPEAALRTVTIMEAALGAAASGRPREVRI